MRWAFSDVSPTALGSPRRTRAGRDLVRQWLVQVEEPGQLLVAHTCLGQHLVHCLLQAVQRFLGTLPLALPGGNVEAEGLTMPLDRQDIIP